MPRDPERLARSGPGATMAAGAADPASVAPFPCPTCGAPLIILGAIPRHVNGLGHRAPA